MIKTAIQLSIGPFDCIEKEHLVLDHVGIVAFLLKRNFFEFKGASQVQLLNEANEDGRGVAGQLFFDSSQEGFQVKAAGGCDNGSHAGSAFDTRHFNPVDYRVLLLQNRGQNGLHFVCADIFASPPEGIAHPIDKIHPTEFIHGKQIAASEPHIAFAHDVVSNLFLGGLFVNVTIELTGGMIFDDFANKFSGLAWLAEDTESILISDDVTSLIDLD